MVPSTMRAFSIRMYGSGPSSSLRRRVRERVLVVPRGVAREAFDDDDGRVQDDVAEDPTPGEQVDQVVPDACAVRLEERAAARPREGEVLDDGAPQQPARPDGADAQFALDPLADPADDEAAHALGAELRLAEHVDGDGGAHEAEEDADDDAERDAERARPSSERLPDGEVELEAAQELVPRVRIPRDRRGPAAGAWMCSGASRDRTARRDRWARSRWPSARRHRW